MNDKQMQTYITWINSQLRKRSGSRYIQDLDDDMRDGVAFLQLIEVVAGEAVPHIEFPTSKSEMRANINKVLQFMASKRIKMHNTSPKEIVDGNLKAIMRLVLALAAHFKPQGIKGERPASPGSPTRKLERAPSTMSLAADAAAALADASEAAASAGLSLHYKLRNRQSTAKRSQTPSRLPRSARSDPGSTYMHSHTGSNGSASSGGSTPVNRPSNRKISPANSGGGGSSIPILKPPLSRNNSGQSTPREIVLRRSSSSNSDDTSYIRKPKEINNNGSRNHSRQSSDVSHDSLRPMNSNSSFTIEDILDDQSAIIGDLVSTKEALANLQNLLLNGVAEEEEEQPQDLYLDSSSSHEQVVVLTARLDRRNSEYDQLKHDYFKLREEIVELQGEKSGLKTRLSYQEQTVLDLRGDLHRQELVVDSLSAEKQEAVRSIEERDHQIEKLHQKIASREEEVAKLNSELSKIRDSMASRDHTEADLHAQLESQECETEKLQRQVHELTERLDAIGNCEATINSKIAAYQDKLSLFEDAVTSARENGKVSREYNQLFEILKNMRKNFTKHDSRQHAIDSIEQSLNSLIEKVSVADKTTPQNSEVLHNGNGGLGTKSKLLKDSLRRDVVNGETKKAGWEVRIESLPSTKIVYFANKAVTPFLKILKKRIGEITLADFKMIVNKPGRQRYFFKSLDPEFGSVREELIFDDDVLPGWDEKIVAWVEEEVDDSWNHSYKSPTSTRNDYVQEDAV